MVTVAYPYYSWDTDQLLLLQKKYRFGFGNWKEALCYAASLMQSAFCKTTFNRLLWWNWETKCVTKSLLYKLELAKRNQHKPWKFPSGLTWKKMHATMNLHSNEASSRPPKVLSLWLLLSIFFTISSRVIMLSCQVERLKRWFSTHQQTTINTYLIT